MDHSTVGISVLVAFTYTNIMEQCPLEKRSVWHMIVSLYFVGYKHTLDGGEQYNTKESIEVSVSSAHKSVLWKTRVSNWG